MKTTMLIVGFVVVCASLLAKAEANGGLKIFCPPDKVLYSDDRMRRLNWDTPTFVKAPGAKYPPSIRSNYRSSQMVMVPGVYQVVYTAKDMLGNVAKCNFTMTVKRPSCALPKIPDNGILVCDKEWQETKKNMFCTVFCKDGFDAPKGGAWLRICNYQKWSNYPLWGRSFNDCSVKGKGNLPNAYYYKGNIADKKVQDQVKSGFLSLLKKFTPFCMLAGDKCNKDNLEIHY